MTHIITSLCVREGSCVTACPVGCILPGNPQAAWPWFYIDPDTCIDCGACVPECPFHAIYPEDEVPDDFLAYGGEIQSMPAGAQGFDAPFDGYDYEGTPIHLDHTRTLNPDQEINLKKDIQANYAFFQSGPGYDVLLED